MVTAKDPAIFEGMMAVVKKYGISHALPDSSDENRQTKEKLFWSVANKCRILRLKPDSPGKTLPKLEFASIHEKKAHLQIEAPFPFFSLELTEGSLTSPEPDAPAPLSCCCLFYVSGKEQGLEHDVLYSLWSLDHTPKVFFVMADELKWVAPLTRSLFEINQRITVMVQMVNIFLELAKTQGLENCQDDDRHFFARAIITVEAWMDMLARKEDK